MPSKTNQNLETGATRRGFLLGTGAAGMGAFLTGAQVLTATQATAVPLGAGAATVGGRDKARVAGIVDRGGRPAVPGSCVVIQFNHADVETSQGVYNWSVIDNAIATSISAGAVGVRLRPSSGEWAPAWAKSKFGTVHIVDAQTGAAWDSVRFWTPGFQAAAQAFDAAMAARYDSNSRVREVMAWPNGSEFSCETMLRQFGPSANRQAYLAAGYSYTVDHQYSGVGGSLCLDMDAHPHADLGVFLLPADQRGRHHYEELRVRGGIHAALCGRHA